MSPARFQCASLVIVSVCALAGCAEGTKDKPLRRASSQTLPVKFDVLGDPIPAPNEKTLYEKLGGDKGLTAIAETFVPLVQKQEPLGSVLRERFPDQSDLNKTVVAYLREVTGGPSLPAGVSLQKMNEELGIFQQQNLATSLTHLRTACEANGIPAADRDALIRRLESPQ